MCNVNKDIVFIGILESVRHGLLYSGQVFKLVFWQYIDYHVFVAVWILVRRDPRIGKGPWTPPCNLLSGVTRNRLFLILRHRSSPKHYSNVEIYECGICSASLA
jgi:hypothetical protein